MKKGDIFNKVLLKKPKRNQFDLSHERKFSLSMGKWYPILVEEVYPNEEWDISGGSLMRTAPMVAPMMHTVSIRKHYFFTPNRILWRNWDLFITGGDKYNPLAVPPVPPYLVIPEGGFPVRSVADYLGIPTGQGDGTAFSAFPAAAFFRIYQEYYTNENFGDTALVLLQDGNNSALEVADGVTWVQWLTSACPPALYESDYFTACLPEPQKGPEVTIPLGDTAPIRYKDEPDAGVTVVRSTDTGLPYQTDYRSVVIGQVGAPDADVYVDEGATSEQVNIDVSTTHYTDLSSATSATINSLRMAFSLQRLFERLARGGSRAIEFLKAVWDSSATSSLLDRPEYLGGAKEFLSVSEVLQTSETDTSPQGNMAGHGIAGTAIGKVTYTSKEYGVLIGCMAVMPKTAYQQGIRKSWLRLTDRYDYYFPDLAHIGEQPVLNAEVYVSPEAAGVNGNTFGYMPYGTELRYINDSVHGEFRTTQDFWHMGRIFEALPVLNNSFVTGVDVPLLEARVFADMTEDTDKLYCTLQQNIRAKRSIPLFGTPN